MLLHTLRLPTIAMNAHRPQRDDHQRTTTKKGQGSRGRVELSRGFVPSQPDEIAMQNMECPGICRPQGVYYRIISHVVHIYSTLFYVGLRRWTHQKATAIVTWESKPSMVPVNFHWKEFHICQEVIHIKMREKKQMQNYVTFMDTNIWNPAIAAMEIILFGAGTWQEMGSSFSHIVVYTPIASAILIVFDIPTDWLPDGKRTLAIKMVTIKDLMFKL